MGSREFVVDGAIVGRTICLVAGLICCRCSCQLCTRIKNAGGSVYFGLDDIIIKIMMYNWFENTSVNMNLNIVSNLNVTNR